MLNKEKYLEQIKNFCLMDDDFLTKVFEDNIPCTQLLLSIILEKKLRVLKSVTQYNIKNLQGHSVRLDIYAEDETGRKYNIEIQRNDKGAAFKRARYCSSMIDSNILDVGDDYENLPETYVIFITENDILKGGKPIYHINRCVKETGVLFNDEAHIIYVNSQVQDETALGKLMHDFYCTDAKDMKYRELADRVKYFKEDEEGVTNMCRAMEKLCAEVKEETKTETKAEAIKKIMAKFNIGITEAMSALDIPEEEYGKYTELVENYK